MSRQRPDGAPAGDGGCIQILSASDEFDEASRVTRWIQELINSGTPETELAVLFRNQPELYGTDLRQALDDAGVAHRNENKLQDLATEPIAQLLIAYFETLAGARRPASYVRLHQSKLSDRPGENELFRLRRSWDTHMAQARGALGNDISRLSDRGLLDDLTTGFLKFFGATAIAALHPDYEFPRRVDQVVTEVTDGVGELLTADATADSLSRFADEQGVRLMSIHKSKDLEFDAVAVVAVEREMYWETRARPGPLSSSESHARRSSFCSRTPIPVSGLPEPGGGMFTGPRTRSS